MLSFDPTGTKVILIGMTTCLHDRINLPDLPSVANNIAELSAPIRDPEIIGLGEESLELILDPSSPTDLLIRLSRSARKARDTLLVYYAGHGIKASTSDGLFIATAETTQDDCDLNGVEFSKIRRIIFDSPASKKILIFDCCYSGEILADAMGGSDESVVSNNIRIKGVYSIASSPRIAYHTLLLERSLLHSQRNLFRLLERA